MHVRYKASTCTLCGTVTHQQSGLGKEEEQQELDEESLIQLLPLGLSLELLVSCWFALYTRSPSTRYSDPGSVCARFLSVECINMETESVDCGFQQNWI
jgi:hypothetical protein